MSDKNDNNSDKLSDKWHTVPEAATILGVSTRTVQRRIKEDKIESKLVGGIRYVYIESESDTVSDRVSQAPLIEQLQKENEYLRQQLQETTARYDERSQRQDTIILQLTRQLEQSQRLLEYHQEPWYRKWFRRGRTGDTQ